MAPVHFIALLCASVALTYAYNARHEVRKFPDGFLFGTATASYQVEGAWDVDGKTENIWDHYTHNHPEFIRDKSNGDIADNSYYLYRRDVQMMRELGLDFYRFSVSWTRILPSGFPDKINEAGVQYYNKLIDELLKYNIQPMMTLYHWDLPQKLQDLGGWTNSEIVTWYSDYARVIFKLFGERVKHFITINEPYQICNSAYGVSDQSGLAPALDSRGVGEYMCAKNLLLAHAKAYHIYNEEFRPTQKGKIFISFSAQWYEPATDSEADIEAAYDANHFYWAQYSWPVFSETGDFPPALKKRVAARSAEQGYPRSRLPEFTPEEIEFVKGTSDYFGLNHYSTNYIHRNESVPVYASPSFADDLGVGSFTLPEWLLGESTRTKYAMYFQYVPWGFRKLLNRIKDDYKNPPVFVTENGIASHGGIVDNDRVTYYRGYLDALLDALEDGCDVRGYTAWSLMDNFEWTAGYTERFGLYEVNYDSIYRTRTPRKSAYVYRELLRSRSLDHHYEPDLTQPLTIAPGQIFLCVLVSLVRCGARIVRKFPEGFSFGAATSSYQIEGGWNADGKSENIWDRFVHTRPELIQDRSTGDIAADSYYLYKRDVEMLRELGVDYYRFSISWSRILPTGFPDKINPAGVQYYNNLIDELLKYNIKPMVTIYHEDLPQKLQDVGGWSNPEITNWFSDYANTVFKLFGDRVKYFITINEPWQLYAWPIFSETGDFPLELKKRIAARSAEQGFPRSRLPEFTPEEIELVRGSSDFFSLNHYQTYNVNSSVPLYDVPSFDDDLRVAYYQSQGWFTGNNSISVYTPWAITEVLKSIKTMFKNPPVMITENGLGSEFRGLEDDDRVTFLRGYLGAVLDAIDNGSDVRGYTVWSLMDNMEWSIGYTKHFGLYEVDFENTNRTRTPRKSAHVYRELLRSRSLDHHYEPDLTQPLTIAPGH
ncbi:lactase/phlorizin hydrolase-like [Bicyclus anynana]|uniref:beta-glucosidase n=1 Tax=Bicyclus anynana TaxID=110368 RepID=A0ABM3M2U3_BICAN|nr:lactase/phlorizin hydrolase-like [Bicyclus anynana]